jgi:hypothetical protein
MTGRPPVIRIAHLQGGLRAINELDDQVRFVDHDDSDGKIELRLESFGSLFSVIEQAGIQVLGCDFLTHEDQLAGVSPPEWRSFNRYHKNPWLSANQSDHWSFVAHGAFKNKVGLLWDIARRISHQLRACNWRLRQLSESYRDQSRRYVKTEKFVEGNRFADEYTSFCYLALHAFLIEACVLRDYIAEFYAFNATYIGSPISSKKITTMGSLAKALKQLDPFDQLGLELKKVTSEKEWLSELGAYRDLIIHAAPLASAGRSSFAVQRSFTLLQVHKIKGIKLPLPNDPVALFQEQYSGSRFADPNMNFARFKGIDTNHDSMRDGLEYAHNCFLKLCVLAESASLLTSVVAEMPQLTSEDIIGPVIVDRGGNSHLPI